MREQPRMPGWAVRQRLGLSAAGGALSHGPSLGMFFLLAVGA